MLEWLERRFKSAYLKLLEGELARLREENRQLVNSILASHGMPGIDAPRSDKKFEPKKRMDWISLRRRAEREHETVPVAYDKLGNRVVPEGKAEVAK